MPTVLEINRAAAGKIVAEARSNPRAFPGQFIGLANGQIVIVSNDLDAVDDRLDEVEPDPGRTFIVDLTLDENKVEHIGRAPMPRVRWPLLNGEPVIEVVLTLQQGRKKITRTLLADTGAGNAYSSFEFLVNEQDCIACGGKMAGTVHLGGAFAGFFPRYRLRVEIPSLHFNARLYVIGIPAASGLDGIAGFRFLNRFAYGNFGNAAEFGLEV